MKQFYPILPYDLKSATKRSISLLFALDGILELLDGIYPILLQKKETPSEPLELDKKAQSTSPASLSLEFLKEKEEKAQSIGFYLLALVKASKIGDEKPMEIMDEIDALFKKSHRQLLLHQTFIFFDGMKVVYEKLLLLFEALLPFLQEAKSNENLLFYLIEHEKKWDLHLQEKKIRTILQSLFSSFSELRAVLQEGYTRRGFSSLYEQQEALIEGLQWDEAKC